MSLLRRPCGQSVIGALWKKGPLSHVTTVRPVRCQANPCQNFHFFLFFCCRLASSQDRDLPDAADLPDVADLPPHCYLVLTSRPQRQAALEGGLKQARSGGACDGGSTRPERPGAAGRRGRGPTPEVSGPSARS